MQLDSPVHVGMYDATTLRLGRVNEFVRIYFLWTGGVSDSHWQIHVLASVVFLPQINGGPTPSPLLLFTVPYHIIHALLLHNCLLS